jgi:transposase
MTKRLLPLIPGGLVVEQVLPEPDRITVVARSRLPTSRCPSCDAPSSRVQRPDRWSGRRKNYLTLFSGSGVLDGGNGG